MAFMMLMGEITQQKSIKRNAPNRIPGKSHSQKQENLFFVHGLR